MKKKVPAKQVSDKAKKEELLKKVKASLSKPSKAAGKNKETKKAAPEKKISPKKVKARMVKKPVKVEKEKVGKTVKKVSPGKRTPVKKIAVKKKETLPKAVKKKTPSKAAAETVKGKKVAKKEKAAKIGVKVKDKKALPLRAEKKEKPAAGKAGKLQAASKAETKTGKKLVKRTAEKVRKTSAAETAKKEEDIIKEFKGAGELRKGKTGEIVKEIRQTTEIEGPENIKENKECRPAPAEKWPPIPFESLPSEYGENGITLMVVNPSKLFAFWEVREDTLQIFQGDLKIRLYDITGIDFDSMDANNCIDIAVNDRIGDGYISVSPGKDYIADIGIVYSEGIFISVARSLKASTPHETIAEEKVLPEQPGDIGLRVGY